MVARIEIEEIKPPRHVSDLRCSPCPVGEIIRPHAHHISEPWRSPCLSKETRDPHTHTHQVNTLWQVSDGNFYVAHPTQPIKDLPVKLEVGVRPSGLTEIHTQKIMFAAGMFPHPYQEKRRIVRWFNVARLNELPRDYLNGRGPRYFEDDGNVTLNWPTPNSLLWPIKTVILHEGMILSEETYQEVLHWMRCAGARLGAIQKRERQKQDEKPKDIPKPLEPTYVDII